MILPSVTTTPSSVLLLVAHPPTLVARKEDKTYRVMSVWLRTIKVELISSIIWERRDQSKLLS